MKWIKMGLIHYDIHDIISFLQRDFPCWIWKYNLKKKENYFMFPVFWEKVFIF